MANRYREDENDEDHIPMDEWMAMSDEERQRELDAATRGLEEILARLTPAQLYAHRRRRALASCLNWRDVIRREFIPELAKEFLRKAQIRMVKLRIERATGTYPGEA